MPSEWKDQWAKLEIDGLGRVVGERIREVREARGMFRKELARLAGYAHHDNVRRVEEGLTAVTAGRLIKIAAALDVSVAVLFGEASIPEKKKGKK